MPTNVRDLFAAAPIKNFSGPISWGEIPKFNWGANRPENGPGIYVLALSSNPTSFDGASNRAPIATAAVRSWLQVRPDMLIDGESPEYSGHQNEACRILAAR